MATLADLRDRIIREVNREELTEAPSDDPTAANSQTLDLCIQQAIDYYADERFAFNEAIVPVTTNGEYLPLPENLRKLDAIVRTDGSRFALRKQDYLTIEVWQQDGEITPSNPVPEDDYVAVDVTPPDFVAIFESQ